MNPFYYPTPGIMRGAFSYEDWTERATRHPHLVPPADPFAVGELSAESKCLVGFPCGRCWNCNHFATRAQWAQERADAIRDARAKGLTEIEIQSVDVRIRGYGYDTERIVLANEPAPPPAPPPLAALLTPVEALERDLKGDDDRFLEWVRDGRADLLSEHAGGVPAGVASGVDPTPARRGGARLLRRVLKWVAVGAAGAGVARWGWLPRAH